MAEPEATGPILNTLDPSSEKLLHNATQLVGGGCAEVRQACPNKQISDKLFISVHTVATHRRKILRKTGTTNALALGKWAHEQKMQ